MPFWSGEKLAVRLPDLVEDFKSNAIDCNAYTLSLGDELYTTPPRGKSGLPEHVKRILKERENFTIPPGQFAMLMTKEFVRIPPDAMAFISIKSSIKFLGLINVSGFHVDPGYYGRLVFSVFNAGASPIHLQRDMPLFLIWFADLDRETGANYLKPDFAKGEPSRSSIDLKTINANRDEMFSLQLLSERIDAQDQKIEQAERKAEVSRAAYTAAVALFIAILVALLPSASAYLMRYLAPAEPVPAVAPVSGASKQDGSPDA